MYEDGSVYEGHFKNGLEFGKGRKIFANRDIYEGTFSNGAANGKGKYYYANGDYFEGDWRDNRREGRGRLVTIEEGTWEGNWLYNKRHGNFTLIRGGIIVKKAKWENGILTEEEISVPDKLPGSVITYKKLSRVFF